MPKRDSLENSMDRRVWVIERLWANGWAVCDVVSPACEEIVDKNIDPERVAADYILEHSTAHPGVGFRITKYVPENQDGE